jgi:hypothetical protein
VISKVLRVVTSVLSVLIPVHSWSSDSVSFRLSSDPYSDPAAQHATEVEPAILSFNNVLMSVFQVGRTFQAGSDNIGWAVSRDYGVTWQSGFLPGITISGGGAFDTVTDPSVAYDQERSVWLVASLPVILSTTLSPAVFVSRSTDSGESFGLPITVANTVDADKPWVTCDNFPRSPYRGHCYVVWDYPETGLINLSTSTDGGQTWSSPINTPGQALGLGGPIVVQPNGNVVLTGTYGGENGNKEYVIRSLDGGKTLNNPTYITTFQFVYPAGGVMRADPIPSAAVDSLTGRIYLAYPDCRFRPHCATNDIVATYSDDGVKWSRIHRIPIDAVSSGADHFIVGLGTGNNILGVTYHYFPNGTCGLNSCELDVGFVTSSDGLNWSAPTQLAGPMSLTWLPSTSAGQMVGDYISTTYVLGIVPFTVFPIATAPQAQAFNQSIFATVPFVRKQASMGETRQRLDPGSLAEHLSVSPDQWRYLARARTKH